MPKKPFTEKLKTFMDKATPGDQHKIDSGVVTNGTIRNYVANWNKYRGGSKKRFATFTTHEGQTCVTCYREG